MGARVSQFLAVILTAIALIPSGAHLIALPVKVDMPEEPYFVVQQIYRGWAWLGIVIVAAIFANFASAMLARHHPRQFWLSLAASLLIAATLLIFFTWTYPANQETGNWTSVTRDWEHLRLQWEYSHAVNAAIIFVAFLCSVGAALSMDDARQPAMQAGTSKTSGSTARHA
jgi:MFS family permease